MSRVGGAKTKSIYLHQKLVFREESAHFESVSFQTEWLLLQLKNLLGMEF